MFENFIQSQNQNSYNAEEEYSHSILTLVQIFKHSSFAHFSSLSELQNQG